MRLKSCAASASPLLAATVSKDRALARSFGQPRPSMWAAAKLTIASSLALVRGLLEVLDGERRIFGHTPTILEEFSIMILGGREAGVRRLRYPVGT